MRTLPLGEAAGTSDEQLALAMSLYERDVLSLGLAAKVAGLPYAQLIEALCPHGIPVSRYRVEGLGRELDDFRPLDRGR